jgi:hypothetical protein
VAVFFNRPCNLHLDWSDGGRAAEEGGEVARFEGRRERRRNQRQQQRGDGSSKHGNSDITLARQAPVIFRGNHATALAWDFEDVRTARRTDRNVARAQQLWPSRWDVSALGRTLDVCSAPIDDVNVSHAPARRHLCRIGVSPFETARTGRPPAFFEQSAEAASQDVEANARGAALAKSLRVTRT